MHTEVLNGPGAFLILRLFGILTHPAANVADCSKQFDESGHSSDFFRSESSFALPIGPFLPGARDILRRRFKP